MRLADYIVDFFSKKKVHHCFTVTGGGAMHLNNAFGSHSQMKCIYNHHEQACAMAAEGYARATGDMPVVCVTSGPGGTNALTGVLGSWLDSVPMFVVSGQVKNSLTVAAADVPLRQLGDQEYKITEITKSLTKYSAVVKDAQSIAYHLEKAWFLANNGRCGPVWLDIPLDVQAANIDPGTLQHYNPSYDTMMQNPQYNQNISTEILQRIAQAKRPVIMAGEGIRMSGAVDEFLALASLLNIPVLTAWNAHDIVPDSASFYCGRPGTLGTRGGNFIAQSSDLMLILGCRMNVRQIGYVFDCYASDAYKIMVDIDAAELFKPTLQIDLPVHANVKDVIDSLLSIISGQSSSLHQEWLRRAREIDNKYPAVSKKYKEDSSGLNPYVFFEQLFSYCSAGDTIVTSNGSACVISFQTAHIKPKQRLFTNSGCASMGYGLPAALGAACGTGRPVVCVEGDGSVMMNLQELATIVQNNLPVRILLINNKGYHSIRQTQNNLFAGHLMGVGPESGDLSFPDFEKLSAAFGLPYYCIKTVEDCSGMLQEVLEMPGPCICEVFVTPEQAFEPKLSSKKMPDGTMVSPEIDDMFPFLDKEEYYKNKEYLTIF